MLLSLNCEGIPSIYDIVEYGGTSYLIMDYIEGKTLEEAVKDLYPLPTNLILNIEKQICRIISHLHENGILFNDIKPNNIIINNYNKVFLIDFGICKSIDSSEKRGVYYGTYTYSSPEQIEGNKVDVRSDIYALGATLYYLTECSHPNIGKEQMFRENTDYRIKEIIKKSMSINVDDRYKSVDDLYSDLDSVLDDIKNNVDNFENNTNQQSKVIEIDGGKNRVKKKIINLISIAAALIIVLLIGTIIGGKKEKLASSGSNQNNNMLNYIENNQSSNGISDGGEALIEESSGNNQEKNQGEAEVSEGDSQSNTTDLEYTAEAFNGEFITTVNSYNIYESDLAINVTIKNNYSKEVQLYQDGIYVMNSEGKRFELDVLKHLAKQENTFKLVSGEEKEFTFYFKEYEESSELNFVLDKIWVMGPESMTEVVKIKIR